MKLKKAMYDIIPIDIYDTDLLLVVGDMAELNVSLEDNLGKEKGEAAYNMMAEDIDESTTGRTALLSGGQVVLWLPDASHRGAMAHEIFHAVCFVMRKAGIGFSDESEEAFAYLTGYLTDKVNEALSLSFETGGCGSLSQ